MNNVIIEFKNVGVCYDHVFAIKDISFSIQKGEHVAILGPNGAGKSTLIKALLGLLTPSEGTIQVLGKSPNELSFHERSQIGYVPQYQKLDSRFPITVKEVVLMGRYSALGLLKRPRNQDREAVKKALELMGISSIRNKLIGNLSGGERQRTLLARALVNDLKILILDEPTTSLDVQSTEGLHALLNDFRKRLGITVIVISHDVGVVTKMADKIACLAGRLVAHGRPSEALTEATIECMYGKDTAVFGHSHVPHVMVQEHKKKNGGLK